MLFFRTCLECRHPGGRGPLHGGMHDGAGQAFPTDVE